MEDQELREDLRGVKKTLKAQERAKESFKREMRDNITNLKEGMKGLEEKMMNKMETSFEKMLERMQRRNESEETRRLRSIAEVVRKGKELGDIEKRILESDKVHTIGEQNTEVVIIEVRGTQVAEREETQTQKDTAVPQPKGTP